MHTDVKHHVALGRLVLVAQVVEVEPSPGVAALGPRC